MTLRARLVLSITLLLALMILALGAVAVRSAQRVLVAQIDEDLREIAARNPFAGGLPDPGSGRFPLRQAYALVVVGPQGGIALSLPSGFEGDPDPLPDVTGVDRPDSRRGVLATLPAVQGDVGYRALVLAGPRDATVVVGHYLNDVAAATRRLLRAIVVGGVVVLTAGGVATWLTVRRETRSIDEMVDATADVAAGHLDRRITDEPSAEELGRLRDALNDMFERNEQAFERERSTQARLRQFVADASHELRTPITTISGYAQLARKGGLEDPGARTAAMERIETESDRMRRLVDDLGVLARLDEARPVVTNAVALAPIVEAVVADHRAVASDHPVSVDVADLAVEADADALTQVLGNLLANVRAHTPPGTATTVSARRDGATVTLAVTDDGPGIDPTHLGHVFDRFYQARDPRRRSGPGSGLGLAIVAGLVERMGGTVSADPAEPSGLRLSVRLPAADNGLDDTDQGATP